MLTRLRQVGNKLRSPEQAEAFSLWARAWHLTVQLKAKLSAQKNNAALYAAQLRGEQMEARIAQLEGELHASIEERRKLRERISELDGGAAEAQRLHEELLAKEKEVRVGQLAKQAARRVLSSQLSQGFGAWFANYQARSYALDTLRLVGNRLRTPELNDAFDFWSTVASEARRQRERVAWQSKEQGLTGKVALLGAELQRVRAECEQKLAAAAREHEASLQRIKLEMSGGNDVERRAREAADKEARIKRYERQFGRRMLNAGLTRGWQAWHEFAAARAAALRTLRRVAGKLQEPAKVLALETWAADLAEHRRQVEAIRQRNQTAKLEEQIEGLKAQLRALLESSAAKQREAEAERAELQRKVTQLSGGTAEIEALLEAQLAKEKEERVELCRRQSMRRMLNRDLASGFSAWLELAEAKQYAVGRLRACARMLKSPELAEAFGTWTEVWEEGVQRAAMTTYKQQAEQLAKDRDRVIAELQRVSAEYEAMLKEASEAKELALHRQRVELCGSAEELAGLKEEKGKEARVEMLRRQSMRRIQNRDLGDAWSAWVELWEARSYALTRMREVGQQLRSPELLGAWAHWDRSTAEERQFKEKARLERETNSLEAQLRRTRHEAAQLELQKTAHIDEIKALRERTRELAEECNANEVELVAAAGMRLKFDSLVEAVERAQAASEEAERLRQESEEDALAQRRAAQQLLERLLAEQRSTFDEEREQLRMVNSQGKGFRDSVADTYDEERQRYKEQMTTQMSELRQARDESNRAGRELRTCQEQVLRMERDKEGLKATVERLEKELKEERAKPKAPPKPLPKPPSTKKGSSTLGKIDLDEGPDAPPIQQQIAAALRQNAGKVMDLFREWDADGDGEVSKKEFRKAMPAIGLDVSVQEVDALFDSWDRDGGGALNFKELSKVLKSPPSPPGAAIVKQALMPTMAAASAMSKFKKQQKPPAPRSSSPVHSAAGSST